MKTTAPRQNRATLAEARRLVAVEHARKLKLENDERAGRLIDVQLVKQDWARHIANAKSHLRGIPSRLHARCPAVERGLLMLLGELIDEALDELAAGAADQKATS